MKRKWMLAHMRSAFNYAACSDAERLKVGAIVVHKHGELSIGINGTPAGWETNVCERRDASGNLVTKPEVVHAEVAPV